MEYSTHVFIQQSPITEQNFESKLQDISDQITTNGCTCSNVFAPFTNLAVQQAVVSSRHIAFLLQDGRICRVPFRIQADKIELNSTDTTKPKVKQAPSQITRSQSRQLIHRINNFDRPTFENLVLSSSSSSSIAPVTSTNGQIDLLPQLQAGYSLNRRHHLIRTPRGRTGIIFGSRPLIPASSVPEELIEQVQVVLQGKSRNIILRELQRTNLDVNLAVNNLLARDNEGDEDFDDDYVGADLISLLDVNSHNEHPGIILESEFFDDSDFALRYSNIQRRVVSARIASNVNNPSSSSTINSNVSEQSSTTTNPSTVVTSSTTSNDRDRKRNRYDPRWLDGSLREELFGRIDRELKPDDLSLVKDSNTKTNTSSRKDQSQQHYYQHQNSAPGSIPTTTNVTSSQNPIIFGEQLQFWTDSNSDNIYPRFTHIACLYSELIAINTNGQLCQWNWHDDYPYQDYDNIQIKHPKTLILQLFNEKLINISANIIRASILTETNRIATWIDESLGTQVNLKYQHSLQDFSSIRIIDIQTSPLYTIFRTDTNDLYWYGLLPYKPRKKLLERLKDKTRHKNRTNTQQQQIITVGCSVCLISNPYYNQGAWAFYIHDGQPKLGQLMEQAWILSNTARFRIKTFDLITNKIQKNDNDDKSSLEMPPPPSPASSTCSVDSNTSFASSLKRKKQHNTNSTTGTNLFLTTINDNNESNEQQHSKIKDEEYWPLDEVIFIEDCRVAPIGKVMKIDGPLVLVKFPSKNNDINDTNIDANNLENCRILRKDDLLVVKGNQVPKTPDCTLSLSNAKRISLEYGTLLTYSVDKDYLHTLQLRDTTISYIMYEVGSNNGLCRSIRQNNLPLINNRQSLLSFIGENKNLINLYTLNSIDIPRILIDSNHLIYPLIYNQDNTNIKDPQWKNLLPINYFSQGIIPLKINDHTNKNHIILNIMQIQKGILIPHILRYDIDKIRLILNDIEINKNYDLLKLILNERIDGYRNLFHACVHIAIPITNKEYLINDEQIQNETNNNLKRISFAIDFLHSQTNTDHNEATTTRINNSSTEQSINTWPPPPPSSNESSVSADAQSLSSPIMPPESASNFYRSLSNGTTTTTTNAGSLSPSYTSTTLSSKIQYLQNQVIQQQTNHSNGSILNTTSTTRSIRSNSNDFTVWSSCKYDEREKRLRAIKILRLLLDYPLFQEHLLSLLSFQNFEGQTPFMYAINSRAYHSALILFEYAMKIAKHETSYEQSSSVQFFLESSTFENIKISYQNILLRMIYPLTSNNSDYSPLYTICTNDTCSFTWTGEEHISQAIFECKTCGLSGTLCCCSECAQTCHKGHDCRLKRTSPTAYCDCWELCKCKSLIAGDQQKRFELFKLLLNETNLIEIKNSRYENLLLFLVQTVGRQIIEQQQFVRTSTTSLLQQQARKTREQLLNNTSIITGLNPLVKKLQNQISSSGITNTNNTSNSIDLETNVQINNMPDHHLEPLQFCRRALELILTDWPSVKSMLLCGCPDDFDPTIILKTKHTSSLRLTCPPIMSTYNNNDNIFSLDEQQQTSQLDRFTYFLIVKCNTIKQTNSTSKISNNNDLLDLLLNTLLRELSNPTNYDIAHYVSARFVRSIIRLFIILSLQIPSDKISTTTTTTNSTIKRTITNTNLSSSSTLTISQLILVQCKRVFQTLTLISVHALVQMSDLLLSPVRHGITKPIAIFNLLSTQTDILQSLDDIFNIDSEYYRAYQRYPNNINEINNDNTNIDLIGDDNDDDDDDNNNNNNNFDHESQHEIINPINNLNVTTASLHENLTSNLSDNESEMELELLAESDTDNESNHSALNTNTHRTSATAGSEHMTLFSDDDNSESDDADSVRSDSVLGEGDETSQHEPMIFDDTRDTLPITTTTTTTATTTNDRLPSVSSTNNNSTGSNTQTVNSTTSHLNIPRLTNRTAITGSIFGDNPSRRQTTPITTTTSNINQPTSSQQTSQSSQQQQTNNISINITNSLLARAFGILIRQITDLLVRWPSTLSASSLYHDVLTTSTTIDEQNTFDNIQKEIEQCLLPSWQWFATVMDSFESQIRFGMTLSNLVHNEHDTTFHGNRFLKNLIERTQIETKKKSTTNRTNNLPTNDKPINNRLDFLNYSLSLMRSTHEHGDQEPLIDVLSYKHLAYLLDGFIYYFRENGLNEINQSTIKIYRKENTNENINDINRITSNDSFFHRSSSTLCLSSLGPDPFQITIDDSLPLACRPQLLQPIYRKEDLFGRFLYDQTAEKYSHLPSQLSLSNREYSIPNFLQPNYLNLFNQTTQENIQDKTNIKTRDDDRMAVDVLLDLSAGLVPSNKSQKRQSISHSILLNGSYEYLLARWRFSIELFVKLFLDDVGNEPGSIINESSGFSAREQRFRHDMERLKNTHQKDIRFEAMDRDRISLIQKTFRTLNSYYYRNQNINSSSSSIPPLAVQRVKVTFKDEPGEGTGVARSFYASIVEAILSEEKLPTLDLGTYNVSSSAQTLSGSLSSSQSQQQRLTRERRTALATYLRSDRRSSSMLLSADARPFKLNLSSSSTDSTTTTTTINSDSSIIEHWTPIKIKLGLSIYPKVAAIQPIHVEKITGMLLEGLPTSQLQRIINIDEDLRNKIDEAMNILTTSNIRDIQQNETLITNERLLNNNNNNNNKILILDKQLNEYAPLFWQPDKKGVYAPRPGKYTSERLSAYRNVGRLIGLCLLQNELLPLPLCRHVIKYILNRPIRWHDLAFFDSTMYENLRRTAYDAEKNGPDYINDLHLTFSMNVTEKEGGETYDLIPNGSSKDVTYSNLYEFIKRYAQFRMIHLVEQSLQHLRLGVFDVLPSTSLDYLSPEDFRLLLNGTSNINITTLMTYTTFNDESGEINERINQFKKWFWSVLEKFNPIERQDLVYFWTGSPALPASEGGFQPQPSVTIRPADDQHLPTANTCISRLYVPLYSSKTILKLKLQYAIKTKIFGFV
ncbi:unnamed protein product [Rotaria sp. Silwood1]|nr:unnamed protein product [Rotaria sp. Silwood1]CAF1254124.1 unnamed protein product [Rotaria sp. Silwood1]